jgi:predicted HD phosphohydrolase
MGESLGISQTMEKAAACDTTNGASDDHVVAALLHDVGYFVSDFPIDTLENGVNNFLDKIGAQFLSLFSASLLSNR